MPAHRAARPGGKRQSVFGAASDAEYAGSRSRFSRPKGRTLTPDLISRLAREAQLLARLNHPNVIRVLDYDDSPIPYVTMEFVEGLSLADLIEQTGGLRVPRTADIMIQVANGLAAGWEVGTRPPRY